MQLPGNVAIVTGASGGIGRALTIELGLHGMKIVATGRSSQSLIDTSRLLSAYDIEHIMIVGDLRDEEFQSNLIHTAQKTFGRIDVFVHNAGIGLFDTIADGDLRDAETLFKTNFWAPLQLMKKLAKEMQGGTIVSVSSAAAKYAPYRQGIYAASKAALERITEALGIEGSIRTLVVVPDRTQTAFMRNVIGPKENAKLAPGFSFAAPEVVAKTTIKALRKDRRVAYPTIKSRVYTYLSAGLPSVIYAIQKKAI